MLAFIDESGHPHPNDPTTRPVVVAVCIPENEARHIGGRLHGLKRDVLNNERMEMKGVNLLNRGTFRRKPGHVAFVEEFFSALLNLPIVVFGIIMERPSALSPPLSSSDELLLPRQFRFLVQRIELLAEQQDQMATILFDGTGGLYGGLSRKFDSFLYRSDEGRACTHITDAPFFVDSETSAGIQIADMVASVVRQYEEAELFRRVPVGDQYLLAIRRYYRIVEQKTMDLKSHDGFERPGLYRLSPEQGHMIGGRRLAEEPQLP